MAVVPPGNKQLGEHVAIAIATPTQDKVSATNYSISTTAVVRNITNASEPMPVNWIQLGEFTTVGIATPDKQVINLNAVSVLAVVSLAQPTVYRNMTAFTTALVKDPIDVPLTPFSPILLGDHSAVAVAVPDESKISAECLTISVLAVVKPYYPRKELTIFNIEYAAEN